MKIDNDINWYALRVPYSREMKLKALFDSLEVNVFVPMQCKIRVINGKEHKSLVPAIHNLIFVHSTREFLNEFKSRVESSVPFRYIMDKATNQPVVVSDRDMDQFIAIASKMNEQLIYLTKIESTLTIGDKVIVTGGIFEGVEGNVVRIKKDRRVMVSVNNIISVATAHINPLLLKKI